MRSHDWFESSSPPSTLCSASTEWGGSFSDSTCVSPLGGRRAKSDPGREPKPWGIVSP